MRNFLFAATAAAVVAMSSAALADQPADKPTNNGIQAVDCAEVDDAGRKNIGQFQQFIRNDPQFGDANNLAQHGQDLEADVGEFMQLNLSLCGIGSDPS